MQCYFRNWKLDAKRIVSVTSRTWFGTFTHTCAAPQGMVVGTCCLQERQPLPRGKSPVSCKQIGQPLFFCRQLLMWFGTFTPASAASRGFWVWTCCLQGMLPSPWGRSPVSFEQISQTSFFSLQLLMWFGTFTHTWTAPQGMVVGTCCLQGRQPLPWGRSPVSFGQISLGSVLQGKSWDKGPSWKTEPRPICPKLTGDLSYGRGCLPLRWQVPTTIPQGRVQVWVNVPNHVWSCWPWMMHHPGQGKAGEELRQGSFQPCPAQDGASFMAGGSRCDLAHLLAPVLLLKG